MKALAKVFLVLATMAGMISACATKSDIDDIQKQLDALKSSDQIQAISGQISSIQASLTSLQATDAELSNYIETLKGQAESLETAGGNLEDAIGTLQKKDEDLQKQIDELKAYAENGLKDTRDWAAATFATLEEYNKTAEIVAGIQTRVEALKSEITEASSKALTDALAKSEESMRNWINEQLTGYYTIAEMDTKLELLEDELNEQKKDLTDLIGQNAKDIEDLTGLVDENRTAISDLADALSEQKTSVTTAYTAAIAEAVKNQGVINKTVQDTLTSHNSRLLALNTRVTKCETDIAAINDEISKIKEDIAGLKDDVSAILSRVQSITYIPKYADGVERVVYTAGTATAEDLTLRFDIHPADCADSIVKAYDKYLKDTKLASPLTARAVYTLTRAAAGDFVNLGITSVTAEKDPSTQKSTGVLSVTVSPATLGNEFFQGALEASLVLSVSTGSSDIQSDYIRLALSRKANSQVDNYYSTIPFTITSIGATSVSLGRYKSTQSNAKIEYTGEDDIALEYRKNSGDWTSYSLGKAISLADTDSLQFRSGESGNKTISGKRTSDNCQTYYNFKVSGEGKIIAFGNIMSLIDKTLSTTAIPDSCFCFLFHKVEHLISAANLKLPATQLSEYCYSWMFYSCTNLVSAPKLPAAKMAYQCYNKMFGYCLSLKEAPALPAKRLATLCYAEMFNYCTSLTAAPELPAIDLSSGIGCYSGMFSECKSLTSAPKLPATRLSVACYRGMFRNCTNLTAAPELNATTLAESCYEGMFVNCTSLTAAPMLPAADLATDCYKRMFEDCTSLNYVEAMFTTAPLFSQTGHRYIYNYTDSWLRNVADTGTFVRNEDAHWAKSDREKGIHTVPKGWTILTE